MRPFLSELEQAVVTRIRVERSARETAKYLLFLQGEILRMRAEIADLEAGKIPGAIPNYKPESHDQTSLEKVWIPKDP